LHQWVFGGDLLAFNTPGISVQKSFSFVNLTADKKADSDLPRFIKDLSIGYIVTLFLCSLRSIAYIYLCEGGLIEVIHQIFFNNIP
jgi:hypothetical protein